MIEDKNVDVNITNDENHGRYGFEIIVDDLIRNLTNAKLAGIESISFEPTEVYGSAYLNIWTWTEKELKIK